MFPRFPRRILGAPLALSLVQSLLRTSPEPWRGSSRYFSIAFLSSFTHQCFSCRRSPGVQWILTKTPGGRLALVTSRSMIWFWLASNTCRKARGSVIFASTDLSNRYARLMTPRPSHHVLSPSFRFHFTPIFSFLSTCPRHVLFVHTPA